MSSIVILGFPKRYSKIFTLCSSNLFCSTAMNRNRIMYALGPATVFSFPKSKELAAFCGVAKKAHNDSAFVCVHATNYVCSAKTSR